MVTGAGLANQTRTRCRKNANQGTQQHKGVLLKLDVKSQPVCNVFLTYAYATYDDPNRFFGLAYPQKMKIEKLGPASAEQPILLVDYFRHHQLPQVCEGRHLPEGVSCRILEVQQHINGSLDRSILCCYLSSSVIQASHCWYTRILHDKPKTRVISVVCFQWDPLGISQLSPPPVALKKSRNSTWVRQSRLLA